MLFNKFKRDVEDVTYEYNGENPYLNDILKYIGQIGDILDKKQMQRDNIDNELNKVDLGKFKLKQDRKEKLINKILKEFVEKRK